MTENEPPFTRLRDNNRYHHHLLLNNTGYKGANSSLNEYEYNSAGNNNNANLNNSTITP